MHPLKSKPPDAPSRTKRAQPRSTARQPKSGQREASRCLNTANVPVPPDPFGGVKNTDAPRAKQSTLGPGGNTSGRADAESTGGDGGMPLTSNCAGGKIQK